LSRSFVSENQRERILAAVADVVSAASYAEMTVEGIIVTAGISRRTFYGPEAAAAERRRLLDSQQAA
jgi:hypothetical protein